MSHPMDQSLGMSSACDQGKGIEVLLLHAASRVAVGSYLRGCPLLGRILVSGVNQLHSSASQSSCQQILEGTSPG